MIRTGSNLIEGVAVEVVRKRVRRINLRVDADGGVHLSLPRWWTTLKEAEKFLMDNWSWVQKARSRLAAKGSRDARALNSEERGAFAALVADLHGRWCSRLCENGVGWRVRDMKSMWGSCHWRKRIVTYNSELARAPRELVEYVVVHELTHLRAHDHGRGFYALMDERLPGWKDLRRRLSRRQFDSAGDPPPPRPVRWVQSELW